MAAEIPKTEPLQLVAGDTLKFTKSLPDYLPADSWVLSYALVKDSTRLTFAGTDNADGTHLVTVAASVTQGWPVGAYRWQAYVTKATERYRVGEGRLEVCANFALADAGYDARSHARIMLDSLEEAMRENKDSLVVTYSIAGGSGSRSRTFETRAEIQAAWKFWKAQVARERPGGLRRTLVEFG